MALQFEAPVSARAHQALKVAARADGIDVEALRRLLWLVNAHPKLVAHLLVFENLGILLRSEVFSAATSWAGGWTSDIGAWIDICNWVGAKAQILCATSGLELFNREPIHERHHPHFQLGISRHGIVGALWNQHELAAQATPSEEDREAIGSFQLLRAHVVAAHIECRWRLSSLEFYEGFMGCHERPVAPILSSLISPLLRDLSKARFANTVRALPQATLTPAFADQTLNAGAMLHEFAEDDARFARRASATLKRYFRAFQKVRSGRGAGASGRWRGSRSGSRERRPGYVQLVQGVYEGGAESDETDTPFPASAVFIDQDDEDEILERSGISPAETMNRVIELVEAKDLQRGFLAYQWRWRAISGRAQRHRFAYSRLTSPELGQFWRLTERIIGTSFDFITNVALVEAGLALRLSFVFGQSLDTVLNLQVRWIPERSALNLSDEDPPEHPVLIVEAPELGNFNAARVVGMLVPTIHPDYRTELPEELADIDREYVSGFVLNDYLGVGADLAELKRRLPDHQGRLWKSTPEQIKQTARSILANLDERLRTSRIARTLSDWIFDLTGDHTLSWITTGDRRRRNEPRMHYTRYPISRIDQVYFQVCRHLAKIVGAPRPRQMVALPNPDATVGARFVAELTFCKLIVDQLLESLSDRYLDRESAVEVFHYHNRLVLYLVLFQGLTTGVRVTNPGHLFTSWRDAGSPLDRDLLVSVADKEMHANSKARLGSVRKDLAKQFAFYQAHLDHLKTIPWLRPQVATAEATWGPLFLITGDLRVAEVTPTWLQSALEEWTGYPVPENFHRAFLRTELLDRRASPEVIDAFMGHANAGEGPFEFLSSFDYSDYLDQIEPVIGAISADLGLRPVESRLIPYTLRSTRS
jgi:hypothetical protein